MRARVPVTALALTCVVGMRAQQLTQYSQYVFNHFSVNPAVAGSKECLDVRLGFREQWTGFDGAPTTGWASLHGTLRGKKKPVRPGGHGVGAFVEADNAGNWGYTRLVLAYAYHMPTGREGRMAFGVFAGAQQMKFDIGRVTLTQYGDPALDGRASVMVFPEVTPGFWMYNKRSWAGISMHQALGNRIKDIGMESRLARHLMLSAGHRMPLGPKTTLTPSTLMKFSGGAPMALDLNAMAEWNRTIALGAGYRAGDAVVFLMKVSFLKFFQLGYSYDITTSKLRVAGNNTHEVILAISPCGRDDTGGRRAIACPAFD